MNIVRKVWNVFIAVLMILIALLLIIDPDGGYKVIVFFIMAGLMIKGIGLLVYYFTMARYAVGGIAVFFQGVLLFDAGLFFEGLDKLNGVYTLLYLIICMLVAGAIDVMRANESRTMYSGRWRLQMAYGAGNIILGIVGLFFLHSFLMVAIVYALSLIHSAICRMINTFRKTDIVYIGV